MSSTPAARRFDPNVWAAKNRTPIGLDASGKLVPYDEKTGKFNYNARGFDYAPGGAAAVGAAGAAGGGDTHLHQSTKIEVHGQEPSRVAQMVERAQGRVNSDLVRTFSTESV